MTHHRNDPHRFFYVSDHVFPENTDLLTCKQQPYFNIFIYIVHEGIFSVQRTLALVYITNLE